MNQTTNDTRDTDAVVPVPDSQSDNTVNVTSQQKRDLLRERIEAGERRNQQRSIGDYAKDTAESVTTFAKEKPLTAIAGAIGLGLVIGALTRPGRRVARQGARKTSSLASTASDAVLAFGAGLIDDITDLAGNSGDALEDAGHRIGDKSRTARRGAAYRTEALADDVASARRALVRKTSRGLRDLRNRSRH